MNTPHDFQPHEPVSCAGSSSTHERAQWRPLFTILEPWAWVAADPEAAQYPTVLHMLSHVFAALAQEASAHWEYGMIQRARRGGDTRSVTQGLERCIRTLTSAAHHWTYLEFWYAQVEENSPALLDRIQRAELASHNHTVHIAHLLARLQDERADASDEQEVTR